MAMRMIKMTRMRRMERVRMKMKKMRMMQMPIIAGQTCPVMHSALPTPDLGKSQLWNGWLTLEALLESIRGKKDTWPDLRSHCGSSEAAGPQQVVA